MAARLAKIRERLAQQPKSQRIKKDSATLPIGTGGDGATRDHSAGLGIATCKIGVSAFERNWLTKP